MTDTDDDAVYDRIYVKLEGEPRSGIVDVMFEPPNPPAGKSFTCLRISFYPWAPEAAWSTDIAPKFRDFIVTTKSAARLLAATLRRTADEVEKYAERFQDE
jgi:hypothetical protein